MRCATCDTENPPQAKFCLECATPLVRRCSGCGTQLPDAAKFCMECAHPVAPAGLTPAPPASPRAYTPRHLAEKILASRTSLEGERKQVTVLFADIVGSTELIRDLDAEDAQRLLDGATRVMMDAVHRFEGTVSRSMGDGVMALFGAPIAHEDHAVRACYAALALQDGMRRYADDARRSFGIGIEARVGLNSGEVIVRLISDDLHMDYTAMGQTVHLASRMEQAALPGGVALTPDVLSLVEGYVQVRSLGTVPVKGLDAPIEIYQLLGAEQARTRLQAAAARGLTRFVGRDHELGVLVEALQRAQAGHGQVAALVGEPGVGKSRLVWELTHSHRTQDWLVLESGSVSYGKATSWLPVVDLLKVYCRIETRDDARAIREKVTGKLLTLDEGLRSCLPALLALLDVPSVTEAGTSAMPKLPLSAPERGLGGEVAWDSLDPPQRRRQTLDAVRRLLLRESREQPLLLVFEDLHWIDSESQALLDSLVDSLPTARIMLLVNYRPEYRHEWSNRGYYSQLRIDPLAAESADELLAGLLGADASLDALKGLLVERTEGNPLFLEESVRSLVEGGALVGERGAYRLPVSLAAIRIPPTVQAVLAARIDRLPADEKRLLQIAAVIGKDVPAALLQAIADRAESELHRELSHLQAAEFLYEASLFPEPEYTFKHALTHEVAYGSLLQDRRKALHARVVDAVESLYADRLAEHVERLAQHALRAESWVQTVAYCHQAMSRAQARSAHREAVSWFEEALRALAQIPESRAAREMAVDLRLEIREAFSFLGEYPRLREYLREAEEMSTALNDQWRLSHSYIAVANCLRSFGEYEQAIDANERVVSIGRAVGDTPLVVVATHQIAMVHRDRGNLRQTLEILRSNVEPLASLTVADRQRLGISAASIPLSRAYLAWTLAELGEFREALAVGREAIQVAEASGNVFGIAVVTNIVGRFVLDLGDVEQALPLLERGQRLSRERDLPNPLIWATAMLGATHVVDGHPLTGLPLIEEALALSASTGVVQGYAIWSTWLGEAYLAVGRLDDAGAVARTALDYAIEHREIHHQAYALRPLGDVAASGNTSESVKAEARYREALTLAESLEMRPFQARCHLSLGKLYRRLGRLDEARAELSLVVTMLRDMGMLHWLADAEAELAAASPPPVN
jgi:class 3 adenylate cyclase/tetratricopeptide (TPR) repeat protein